MVIVVLSTPVQVGSGCIQGTVLLLVLLLIQSAVVAVVVVIGWIGIIIIREIFIGAIPKRSIIISISIILIRRYL